MFVPRWSLNLCCGFALNCSQQTGQFDLLIDHLHVKFAPIRIILKQCLEPCAILPCKAIVK
jgi:hypothetical protein